MNGRERVLAMLAGKSADRLAVMPITMQFACAQIGAKYRDYCTDYRVLVEAQLVTAQRFDFDYVNTMSDPAREAADCGAAVEFFDDQPAALLENQALLTEKAALADLRMPDPLSGRRMHNAINALMLFKEKLKGERLIEGWIEGPCAEAADLRGINNLMLDFFDDPAFVHELFDFVIKMELRFAQAQIEAGADAIGIGDAAASLVGPRIYEEFVWPAERQLVDAIHKMGAKVRLHICGDTRAILQPIGRLGCDIVDLDFLSPMAEGREKMGADQILLGNINPVTVLRGGSVLAVTQAIADCHRQAGVRYIVGAGCEIPRDTPSENVAALADYARNAQLSSLPQIQSRRL